MYYKSRFNSGSPGKALYVKQRWSKKRKSGFKAISVSLVYSCLTVLIYGSLSNDGLVRNSNAPLGLQLHGFMVASVRP